MTRIKHGSAIQKEIKISSNTSEDTQKTESKYFGSPIKMKYQNSNNSLRSDAISR